MINSIFFGLLYQALWVIKSRKLEWIKS